MNHQVWNKLTKKGQPLGLLFTAATGVDPDISSPSMSHNFDEVTRFLRDWADAIDAEHGDHRVRIPMEREVYEELLTAGWQGPYWMKVSPPNGKLVLSTRNPTAEEAPEHGPQS